ncbi:hypothetical protein SAMN06295888_106147 [Desulfonatronum zhilinae]|nr:hypothetical protein SAMN06295888_106147 [Desulfonatronum zhilinae]
MKKNVNFMEMEKEGIECETVLAEDQVLVKYLPSTEPIPTVNATINKRLF